MKVLFLRGVAVTVLATSFCASALAADFFQGFETDNSGWDVFGGALDATRVPSGTGGIAAATGGWYGQAATAATRWGGYDQSLASTGYTTSLDVYLDMEGGWANDTRFDYTSAINNNLGAHRRDFVFSGGFYNDSDFTGSGNRFVFSASNNTPGWPKNPGRDPFAVTTTGWYTLEHNFGIVGGVLSVDMILRSGGSALHSWTLSDASDVAALIGGNRYGWFATNQFGTLAIDNTERFSASAPVPEPFTMGIGIATLGLAIGRRVKSRKA